jgi:proline iminopeptidase
MRSMQKPKSSHSPMGRFIPILSAAVFLFLFPAIACAQTEKPPDSFVTVSGEKIWYQVKGEGEPVVLIPGGPGGSHLYFTPWLDELSGNFKVVYFDAFGRGKSSRAKDQKEYSFQRDVNDLEGLRQALGFSKWSVLGHSYGGMVTQAYALKYPDSVAKLILADTLYDAEMWQANDDNSNYEFKNQYPEKWEKLMALRKQGHKSSSPEHIKAYDLSSELLFFYDASNALKLRHDWSDPLFFNWDVYYPIVGEDGDFVIGGDIAQLDFKKDLSRLKMPVLIIAGRYDRVCIPRFSVKFKEYAPQAEFVMFEKSGHYPFIEEHEKFIEVVSRFLAATK